MSFGSDTSSPMGNLIGGMVKKFDAALGPAFKPSDAPSTAPSSAPTPPPSLVTRPVSADTPGRHKTLLGR